MGGAVGGEALELVGCKTVPLEVPADAELVIEGEVRGAPGDRREEGPFGESTGHYAGPRTPRPTIHVTAITRRHDAMLSLSYQGAPPHETEVLTAVGKAGELLRSVTFAGLHSASLTAAGSGSPHRSVLCEDPY